jgi:hypothetical protein
MQHASAVNARDRQQFCADTGQQLSDGAGAIRHRRVDGKDGRGFGSAVSFKDADAEFFKPSGTDRLGEFFRTGNNVAQAVKIIWIRKLS